MGENTCKPISHKRVYYPDVTISLNSTTKNQTTQMKNEQRT